LAQVLGMSAMQGSVLTSSQTDGALSAARTLPSEAHSLELQPAAACHDAAGRSASRCRFADPKSFVRDFEHLSLALCRCPEELANPITHVMHLGPALLAEFGTPASAERLCKAFEAAGLAVVYKQQGSLKERLQVRRCCQAGERHRSDGSAAGRASPPTGAACCDQGLHPGGTLPNDRSIVAALLGALDALEATAQACFETWCCEAGIPFHEALARFGDDAPTGGPQAGGGRAKSVLNLYHYFNVADCEEEPCRAHADPGLVTVLCRSTSPGLQVQLPVRPGGAPGLHATYEGIWRDAELAMDEAAAPTGSGAAGCMLLMAVGETLERLSGCAVPPCRHRVARTLGPRFNMAYEMRPRVNVWHPWAKLAGAGEGGAESQAGGAEGRRGGGASIG